MRAFHLVLFHLVLLFLVAAVVLPAAAWAVLDPARLPATAGRVDQYSLTPGGTVDGLILDDGTEVYLPPHLGPLLAEVARPGDAVVVYGLRARAIPVVQALSVVNRQTGRSVTDDGDPPLGPPPAPVPHRPGRATAVAGVVKQWLHGPRGDLNGLLLQDGTVVRLPPRHAAGVADRVRTGMAVAVEGNGVSGPQGRVIAAVRVGPEPVPALPGRAGPLP